MTLSPDQLAFAERRRVGRLATADASGEPHVVPVCFAWHDDAFWIAIDEKPKTTTRLKRLENIAVNHHVALVFDHYDDDWTQLAYVLVHGTANVTSGDEEPGALAGLRERYPQYAEMALEERQLIRITPGRVSAWGDLSR